MAVQRRKRTVVDRTTIALRLRDGWGIRQIALGLGLSPGTVSDEVSRNGGCANYEAGAADGQASAKRELTGRKARMAPDGALFTETARLLGLGWSPEQISGRRKREDAGLQQESGLRVSHEAIYALPRETSCGANRSAACAMPSPPAAASRRVASFAASWSA